ncbi:MAG: hypothetical protein OFPII_03650 [Osedax symbiont Rs1]|nr:MAG: hypothetical protein OFPII_03650 [Osedax symbiont Rs1]
MPFFMGISGVNEHSRFLTPQYRAQLSYPLGKLCRGLYLMTLKITDCSIPLMRIYKLYLLHLI